MRTKVSWLIIFIFLGMIAKTSFADMAISPPTIRLLKLESRKIQLKNEWLRSEARQIKAGEKMRRYQVQLQASKTIAISA